MMDKEITELARQLGKALRDKGMKIVTAESFTGGGIAQAITEIPGSSAWFDRGFVTYSNTAKVQMLQVKQRTLDEYGAVSEEVGVEMVEGALINNDDANLAVSVTGIAGPDRGSEKKPVGTVYIALKKKGGSAICLRHEFSGDRSQIRMQTIRCALKLCVQPGLDKDAVLRENKISLYQKSESYLKELLKERLPDNSQIFLFGSRAKETSGEMADIDIGILAQSALPLELMSDLKEVIEESFVPYNVDLVDFTTVSDSFKQHALKKVIPWN